MPSFSILKLYRKAENLLVFCIRSSFIDERFWSVSMRLWTLSKWVVIIKGLVSLFLGNYWVFFKPSDKLFDLIISMVFFSTNLNNFDCLFLMTDSQYRTKILLKNYSEKWYVILLWVLLLAVMALIVSFSRIYIDPNMLPDSNLKVWIGDKVPQFIWSLMTWSIQTILFWQQKPQIRFQFWSWVDPGRKPFSFP